MTKDEIFEVMSQHIRYVEPEMETTHISRDDSLKLLGLDSVARVEVLLLTMESLGVTVSNTEMAATRNLGELVDLFALHTND